MVLLLFLLGFPANISNRSSIVRYGLRCGSWCFITGVWGGLGGNVGGMLIGLGRRDLGAANADDAAEAACLAGVASVAGTADAARSIDVIGGLAGGVIWQVACALAIGIDRCDGIVDADINLDVVGEDDVTGKLI